MLIDQPHRDRFFAKIKRVGDCVEWTAATNADGYGLFGVNGECRLAHRVSWAIKHDSWPTGVLRHTCDNPRCVKLGHLLDGTQKDNMQDMASKSRNALTAAKLTREQADEVRALCSTNTPVDEIAQRYGVSKGHIYQLHHGRCWGGDKGPRRMRRYDVGGEMLSVAEIAQRAGTDLKTIYSRIKAGQKLSLIHI